MRSSKSFSALSASSQGPPKLQRNSAPLYRQGVCHKTHGSSNALNALASSASPSRHHLSQQASSPSSISCSDPEAGNESSLQFPSSAPSPTSGLLHSQAPSQSTHSMSDSSSPGSSGSPVLYGDPDRGLSRSPISPLGSKWPARQMQDSLLTSPRYGIYCAGVQHMASAHNVSHSSWQCFMSWPCVSHVSDTG